MMAFVKTRGGHVTWESVDLRLRAARTIWLATTRPDNRPHAVPVWFLWDGQVIEFVADPSSQKGVNLTGQPWSVLHLGDGDDVIIAEGRCAVVEEESAVDSVRARFAAKYVEPVTGVGAEIPPGWAVYQVPVERIVAWSYGKVTSRTDWSAAH